MGEALSVGRLAQIACLLEATARKPGNVHRYLDFDDCGYLDFGLSAQAIGPVIDQVTELGTGRTILLGVEETRLVVSTNTNLGMLLLLVPLAAVSDPFQLRQGVGGLIRSMGVEDARCVYKAIRLANPGGLGTVPDHDVADEASITLFEAMKLASARDTIALQYVNDYREVFEIGVPTLAESLKQGRSVEIAIIQTHLELLAQCPDTLIARKLGEREASEASRIAREVLETGWPASDLGIERLQAFDTWLRADRHARNPGTTADLVAAVLFVALRAGILNLPLQHPFAKGFNG